MATAHNIQSKRDFVKVLQYIGEGDTVTTPANYGVVKTGTFTLLPVGKVTDINLQPDIQHSDTDVLGNEDVIDAVKTMENYTFSISFEMTDTTLINYAFSPSGGGTGSIDESLNMMFSEYLNGVENYTAMYGCRPTSCTVNLDRGIWTANMTFMCREITLPTTASPYASATPTYASEKSAATITHTGSGVDPFDWNSAAFPESKFSSTVTRGMSVQAINGTAQIVYCKASTRRVDFSVDCFVKAVTLETDFVAKTERVAQYVISTSPDKVLKFVDCVITSYSRQKTASNADGFRESITARAGSVTIAAA
jgi:hypothetical protein